MRKRTRFVSSVASWTMRVNAGTLQLPMEFGDKFKSEATM